MFAWSAFLAVFAALAFAETYSGTLVDANCYKDQKNATSCPATSSTSSFGINTSGKVYMLDDAGNTQAAAALKNRADRSTDQNAKPAAVTVTVTGTQDGDTIKVEKIEVQ